jgi:hypothetical protein
MDASLTPHAAFQPAARRRRAVLILDPRRVGDFEMATRSRGRMPVSHARRGADVIDVARRKGPCMGRPGGKEDPIDLA